MTSATGQTPPVALTIIASPPRAVDIIARQCARSSATIRSWAGAVNTRFRSAVLIAAARAAGAPASCGVWTPCAGPTRQDYPFLQSRGPGTRLPLCRTPFLTIRSCSRGGREHSRLSGPPQSSLQQLAPPALPERHAALDALRRADPPAFRTIRSCSRGGRGKPASPAVPDTVPAYYRRCAWMDGTGNSEPVIAGRRPMGHSQA